MQNNHNNIQLYCQISFTIIENTSNHLTVLK